MSKGLESLKKIKWKLEDEGILGKEYELCDLIEKELKALEIIKKKVLDIQTLIRTNNAVEYNSYVVKGYSEKDLTEEEYDLLKEVLL